MTIRSYSPFSCTWSSKFDRGSNTGREEVMDGVGPAAELRVTWALGATSRLDSAVDAPCASESVQF